MKLAISKQMDEILYQLESNVPGIQATALFDTDGLVLTSRLDEGVDDEIIGAMSASILSIGNRSGMELDRGEMQRIFIEGDNGSIVIMSVGADLLLVALVEPEVKLGMLFFQCRRCIESIRNIL